MRKSDIARPLPLDVVVSLALLTRLPLPKLPAAAFERQAQAAWSFPVVGLTVAGLACVAGWVAFKVGLPAAAAAGLVLMTQIILTGAMHEDGLADTVDGFWGGWDRERRLEIMKDSAIGTYGVLALILSVGLRWAALTQLLAFDFGPVFAAAILSRAALPVFMLALPPARSDGLSCSVGTPAPWAAILSVGLGLMAAWLFLGAGTAPVVLGMAIALVPVAVLARIKIGGQTGDVLGAAQQVAESAALLTLVAVLPD